MKSILIVCDHCGARFRVETRFAGRRGTCANPKCRQEFMVPEVSSHEPVKQPRAVVTEEAAGDREASDQPKPRRGSQSRKAAAKPVTSRRRKAATIADLEQRRSNRPTRQRQPRSTRLSSRAWWLVAGALLMIVALMLDFLPGESSPVPQAAADDPAKAQESAVAAAAAAADENPAPDAVFHSRVLPFLKTHCMDCHGETEPEGGFSFHQLAEPDEVTSKRKQWEKVLGLLKIEAMPPADYDPAPSREDRQAVVEWLDAKLFHVNCEVANDSGRVTIRRLNRNEYNNTVRDLLGVDIDPARDFPSDDVGYGFDNIGDVLTLPPLLLEKYIEAAERIADATIVSADPARQRVSKGAGDLKLVGSAQSGPAGFITMASTGAVFYEFRTPLAGDYTIHIEAAADQAGDELAKVELRVDGRAVKVFEVEGYRKPGTYSHDLPLDAGRHKIEAAFINDYYNPNAEDPKDRDRNLAVRRIELEGPRNATLPEAHRRVVIATPSDQLPVDAAARQIFSKLLPRAFRRLVDDTEIDRFVRLVKFAVEQGDSFERGVQVGVQAMLVSPHFLFRVEIDEDPDNPGYSRELNAYEIASRLSYFLWSTMPDEELFNLARSGQLREPQTLAAQVERMLADARSEQFVQNFGGQWLNLRNLDTITPDPNRFDSFTPELRRDMATETLSFFRHVMREDRSVVEFLTGRYSFVNERLAKHYGIDGVRGEEFQQVSLPAGQRAGVLTHGSILTLTSNPTRTSPVKRGKWILENILGTPPPPAPPNVPELEETARANPGASLREQLQLHRADPGCASCHTTMDAIGFGFENFDAIGRWRERDGELPIDSSGELPGGARFSGPVELVDILGRRDRDFCRSLAEKLLTYAAGRGLEYYDRCAIDEIVERTSQKDYRFSVLVTEIVQSRPFLMRRGDQGVTQ